MQRTLFSVVSLSSLFLVAGCRSGIDCGAYVFDEATQTCVCPAGSIEVPGGMCVAVDGGVGDGGGPDGGTDACSPSTEVCEGLVDEDCDGTVDDGCDCTVGETRPCPGGIETGACVAG